MKKAFFTRFRPHMRFPLQQIERGLPAPHCIHSGSSLSSRSICVSALLILHWRYKKQVTLVFTKKSSHSNERDDFFRQTILYKPYFAPTRYRIGSTSATMLFQVNWNPFRMKLSAAKTSKTVPSVRHWLSLP